MKIERTEFAVEEELLFGEKRLKEGLHFLEALEGSRERREDRLLQMVERESGRERSRERRDEREYYRDRREERPRG